MRGWSEQSFTAATVAPTTALKWRRATRTSSPCAGAQIGANGILTCSRECNTDISCGRYEWFTFPWSACSADCEQTREITCMRSAMKNGMLRLDQSFDQVDDSFCWEEARPDTSRRCTSQACGASGKARFNWFASPDRSGCTGSCGIKTWEREVTCRSEDMAVVSELYCAGLKKPISRGLCGVDDDVSENLGDDLDDLDEDDIDDLIDIGKTAKNGKYVYQVGEYKSVPQIAMAAQGLEGRMRQQDIHSWRKRVPEHSNLSMRAIALLRREMHTSETSACNVQSCDYYVWNYWRMV